MTEMHGNVPLEMMLGWFHNHYEDAAHGVFYDGREGGYQYSPGTGPRDPLQVLQGEFPDADPEVLREAADKLLSEGSTWVNKGVY